MAIVKEVYSPTRVNLIYQLLRNEAESGSPKEYDIRVDELKVVSRTSDPERFHGHEEFVLPETKSIIINIYDGTSNRCTRYNLLLREEEPTKQELSGIEKSINAKMIQERRKWEYDQLKKEKEELEEQLEEAEEFAEQLKMEVQHLKDEKQKSSNKLTDTIINLAGIYLNKNPNALSGVPLIGGLLGSGDKSSESDDCEVTVSEGEAVFSKQSQPKVKTYTGEIKQDDIEGLELALIPFFKEEHLEDIGEIIEYLHKNNNYIPHVLGGLQKALKQNEQTKQAA